MNSEEENLRQPSLVTRRRFLQVGAGALAAFAVGMPGVAEASPTGRPGFPTRRLFARSLSKAYRFLDDQMDKFDAGDNLRLVQSYANGVAADLEDTGFVYDNALMIIAYLQRGRAGDVRRAELLGDSLLYAQENDPEFDDGRVRDAYGGNPFILPDGNANVAYRFGQSSTFVGNMAWAGLALSQLHHDTGAERHLNGALRIGEWIQANTFDTRGAGGYTGGFGGAPDYDKLLFNSIEHNIDVYAFFGMLRRFTGERVWAERARHALDFVEAMWNPDDGHFWTGTEEDGVTINRSPIPEDAQTWSYLALRDRRYAASVDWSPRNIAVTDGLFSGVSFSDAEVEQVWFEGTAHQAAALLERNSRGDRLRAVYYLYNIKLAQDRAKNTDGFGIVAASDDDLVTGFGFSYFASLHTGATSWYCIAAQSGNPFRLQRSGTGKTVGTPR